MSKLTWITANWQDIVNAASGLVITARVIVKWTPTPKDDTLLEKAINFLKHVGLVISDVKKEEAVTPKS